MSSIIVCRMPNNRNHCQSINREMVLKRQILHGWSNRKKDLKLWIVPQLQALLSQSFPLPEHLSFVRHLAREIHALLWQDRKMQGKIQIRAMKGGKAGRDLVRACILLLTAISLIEAKAPIPDLHRQPGPVGSAMFDLLEIPYRYQLVFLDFIWSTCRPFRSSQSIGRHCMMI